MFSVLVIRLRSLRLLRVSGIVMRLRMFVLLIIFLKASHSFRNRLLVICKNAYLFATIFFFQAEDGIRCLTVTGVQTCALPIFPRARRAAPPRARVFSWAARYQEPCRNRSEERRVGKECSSRGYQLLEE